MTSEDPNANSAPEAPSAADGLPVDFAAAAALLPSAPQPATPARPHSAGAPPVTTTDPEGARRAVARAGQALPSAALPDAPSEGRRPVNPEDLLSDVAAGASMREDGLSFWKAIPKMLRLPLEGSGLTWILFVGGMTLVPLLAALPAFLFQHLDGFAADVVRLVLVTFGLITAAAVVGGLARFFHQCVIASVLGTHVETFEIRAANAPSAGVVLLAVLVTGVVPARAVQMLLDDGFLVSLLSSIALLPLALWWPAALFEVTKTDEPYRGFDPRAVRRTLDRAPRHYLTIVGAGWGSLVAAWLTWLLLASLPFAQGFFGQAMIFFTAMAPIAYAHGVMGALYGRLVRDIPEVGEPEYAFLE